MKLGCVFFMLSGGLWKWIFGWIYVYVFIPIHEELCRLLFSSFIQEGDDGSAEELEGEEEEENWEKALSVERFGDIISDSASTTGDRMGRHYTEKDFESKQSSSLQLLNIHYIYKNKIATVCGLKSTTVLQYFCHRL